MTNMYKAYKRDIYNLACDFFNEDKGKEIVEFYQEKYQEHVKKGDDMETSIINAYSKAQSKIMNEFDQVYMKRGY